MLFCQVLASASSSSKRKKQLLKGWKGLIQKEFCIIWTSILFRSVYFLIRALGPLIWDFIGGGSRFFRFSPKSTIQWVLNIYFHYKKGFVGAEASFCWQVHLSKFSWPRWPGVWVYRWPDRRVSWSHSARGRTWAARRHQWMVVKVLLVQA